MSAPDTNRPDARACPVCVYHASNVHPSQFASQRCWNCGATWGMHPHRVTAAVAPGMAYAVNMELPSYEPQRLASEAFSDSDAPKDASGRGAGGGQTR